MELHELERRLERMEAINAILNLMNKYQVYHSANKRIIPDKDEKFLELWAKRAPNTFLEIGPMGRFEGYEGIRQHTMNIAGIEVDMTGRFFEHHITTPLIEVAGDAQTAKAMFFSPGLETHLNPKTGEVIPMWCWGRYRADFIKEDGEWKFWRVKFHVHFCTPYAGDGWPSVTDGAAEFTDGVKSDCAKGGSRMYDRNSDDFDVLRMVPRPFEPYETYTDDMFVEEEF